MTRKARLLLLPLLCLLAGPARPGALGAEIAAHVNYLAGLGSRLPGTPGNRQAADYIEARFRALGLREITRDTFREVVPYEAPGETALLHRGRRLPLAALAPNSARTSMVPPEGLAGPLVRGGDGQLFRYKGRDIEGAIVLLDFNSGDRWREAAMLGAAAVVFTAPEKTTRFEAAKKTVTIPFDLPRFYLAGDQARQLLAEDPAGEEAVIFCRQEWRRADTDNLFALLPGRDPVLGGEIIAIAAHYDSASVVPTVAPGAEQAAGIAVLLELAEHLTRHRPRRSVLFLAIGSHHQSLRGIGDFVNRRWRTAGVVAERAPEPLDIRMMFTLNLSSRSPVVGIHHNREGDLDVQRYFARFAARLVEHAPADRREQLLNLVTPERGLGLEAVRPDQPKTDGQLAVTAGRPAVSLLTAYDLATYAGTPTDRPEHVNFDNLEFQAALLNDTLAAALDSEEMIPDTLGRLRDRLGTLRGQLVSFNPAASFVPDQPVADAFVDVGTPEIIGYHLTDDEGFFTTEIITRGSREIAGYRADPRSGRIVMAPDLGVNGAENYPVRFSVDGRYKEWMIVLFNCLSTNIHDLVDPRYMRPVTQLELLNPASSVPVSYGRSHLETLAVIHTEPGMAAKVLGSTGLLGKRFLLTGATGAADRAAAEGRGYTVDGRPQVFARTPALAAADMMHLNHYRIGNLARFGISNERINEMYARGRDELAAAEAAGAARRWQHFLVASRRALSWQSRAYPDIRETTVDIIKGLIFYFLIMLPFAFFTERLVFGYPDIKRQIAALSGIFLLIYFALRGIHPGFQLTETPELILLGFIVFTLSGLVTILVTANFEEQMRRLRNKTERVFQTDISRASVTGSAFGLGVANMKRRKLRTGLTTTTLVLLTFTVISFTSVRHFVRFNQVVLPGTPTYQGFMVRDRTWQPLDLPYRYLEPELEQAGLVVPRVWYTHQNLEQRITVPALFGTRRADATALLGLSRHETLISGADRALLHGRWFTDDRAPAALISDSMAAALAFPAAATGRATISVLGHDLLVKGIFEAAQLDELRDLDGGQLSPVDLSTLPSEEQRQRQLEEQAEIEQTMLMAGQYRHQPFADVIIVPAGFLHERNGVIRSFAGRPEDQDLRGWVEDLAARVAITIFSGIGDRNRVYSSIGMTSFSGVENLFIPILIASLIVLNTMLGSVYERIREIGIYSSVGLAPSHIAALFFAEACVYAILGAVGGYLLGQVVAVTLTATGALSGLTLNYSSVSAVTSTLVVMATVFASTIFPARQASRLSVPDVTRQWAMPEPEGRNWRFDFPFTVSRGEVAGLMVFLKDYFESFSIDAVGVFYTWDTTLLAQRHEDRHHFGVACRMHLAPFDLGVRQAVTLQSQPVPGVDFYSIRVLLEWLSGDSADWKRVNRRLLNDLRRQFLVWRTIAPAEKQVYQQRGLAAVGNSGGETPG